MNRKSVWLVLSVLVLASLILSACAPAAPTPAPRVPAAQRQAAASPAAQDMVTIRWRTRPDSQAEQDIYQMISAELSKKLEAQGIQLQYDPAAAQGYLETLTAEYSTGSAPDIAWVGGANTADFTSKGVVLNLKPLADADASFKLADYYDAPMRELEQDGKLWGLPRDISTLVMYYNKDMFRAKGLEDPAALAAKGQWNWDAFRQAAITLTDPSAKQYGFSMSDEWGPWGWFVMAGGGSLYNAERTACNLTDPGSIKGLQFMADLFLKDRVGPPPGADSEAGFHAGSVAMFPNGRWMAPSMRQDKFDWGVVEMPEGPAGKKTWLFWGPYLVSATTKHPEQAWLVLKELTSPEVQARLAALGTQIPSHKDKAVLDAFLKSAPPADNTPFVTGVDYAQTEMALFTASFGAVNSSYQTAIDRILAGRATPEEAASQACDTANSLFKR
jgi:multiple sugar transport system substrate-binding protein